MDVSSNFLVINTAAIYWGQDCLQHYLYLSLLFKTASASKAFAIFAGEKVIIGILQMLQNMTE